MLLIAAICAVLIHGAFSAPSPSNVEDDLPSASDNEDSDENPILIFAAKILVKVSILCQFISKSIRCA
jgi:hypothetical protein